MSRFKMRFFNAWMKGAIFLGATFFQGSAIAAANTAVPAELPVTEETSDAPIEEIEITGQRRKISLIYQTQTAEIRMYELFNSLNSDDEFDVTCGWVTHTGIRVRNWECNAQYFYDEQLKELEEYRLTGVPVRKIQLVNFQTRKKAEQLNAEMQALAVQHPELAEAMVEFYEKTEKLAEENRTNRIFASEK